MFAAENPKIVPFTWLDCDQHVKLIFKKLVPMSSKVCRKVFPAFFDRNVLDRKGCRVSPPKVHSSLEKDLHKAREDIGGSGTEAT